MYIRYNNSVPQDKIEATPPRHGGERSGKKPPPPPPPSPPPPPKNPLGALPKELYDPKTHKFFGKISSEDILLIGLIFLALESGKSEDLLLAAALFYILLSDKFDFGNILF